MALLRQRESRGSMRVEDLQYSDGLEVLRALFAIAND